MVLSTYNFIGGANNEETSPLNCINPIQGDKDQGCVTRMWGTHKKLSVKRHVQFSVDQYGVMDMGKNLNSRKRHDGFCVDRHPFGSRSQGQNRSFCEIQWCFIRCKNQNKYYK